MSVLFVPICEQFKSASEAECHNDGSGGFQLWFTLGAAIRAVSLQRGKQMITRDKLLWPTIFAHN